MKRILLLIAGILAVLPIGSTYAATCDQQFYGVLRYGNDYRFNDFIDARNNSNIHYIGNFDWEYTEQYDYNNSSSFPNFAFTSQFTNAGGFIYPGDYYKFVEATSVYTIRKVPATRSTNNLVLKYTTTDYEWLGDRYAAPVNHTECVNYEISWCGDGVIESQYGEACDPAAPGYNSSTCSAATCQPIAQPTCEGLSANPLSGTLPTNSTVTCAANKVNTWKIDCGNGQVFTGNGNNGATQSFQRVCNYTQAGTYTPKCTINGSITSNACQKTVTIQSTNPSIAINKTDANSQDLDGNIGGNDSQTINKNRNSAFRIRVTNNGNEDLRNIRLTDAQATSCAGSVTLPSTRPSSFGSFTTGGSGNHSDGFLQPGEYFEYTCNKPNTTVAYTNTARVDANGRYSNGGVADSDTSRVLLVGPSININKTDSNPTNDIDGSVGNDTQTVATGDTATFFITVRNDGQEDLKNIVLTDVNGPACAGSLTLPNIKPSSWTQFSVTGAGNHSDGFLQPGESFSYKCAKSNTQNDYTNTAAVNAAGRYSNDGVSDNDPTQVLVAEYDLALRKLYTGPTTVSKNDSVTFSIEVINQGEVDASNIVITDYIPDGITLDDINWNTSGLFATRTIANLSANSSTILFITFKVDGDVFGAITNFAEISADDGDDCDSIPDQNNSNDGTVIDNAIGTGCEPGGDEDDHDPASITVVAPAPEIGLLKYSANLDDLDGITADSNITNDTQSVLIGSGAVFKIVVENTGTEDLEQVVIGDVIAPACNRADVQTQALIAAVGNTDSVFNPGEVFSYECSLANTTVDYTNTARVDALGVDTAGSVNSTDTTQVVVVLTPSIQVDKIDNKPGDLDGVIGNDTQTINYDGTSTFTITVTNNGTEDLKQVALADAQAPACNRTDAQTQVLIALVGNNDIIFNVGEVFSYNCDDTNVVLDYTNTIEVDALGNTSNTSVGDDDTSDVIAQLTPSVTIDKIDNNLDDLDSDIGNDTQTILAGSGSVFKIRVTNDGTEDLTSITLSDSEATACGGSVVLPSTFPLGFNSVTLSGSGDHADTLLQPGEYFEYSCSDANVLANYTNSVTVNADGNVSGTGVTATDTSDVVIQELDYDLALRKTYSGTGTVSVGDVVLFNIEVFNQGEVAASNIEITDYIPAGLTLTGSTWTLSGSLATQTIANIPVGTGATILPISFIADGTVTNLPIFNFAEISVDDGDDCDSLPDQDNTNDGTVVDDATGVGCEPTGDEDDHDVASVTVTTGGGNDKYDLALRKTTTLTGVVMPGDVITFDIEVYNQGTLASNQVEITDYIPAGLTLTGSTWTLSGSLATQTIANIPVGTGATILPISFIVDTTASGSISNYAEISSDNGADCDSTPDQDNTNDGTILDNDIGSGCEPGGDEDDHDIETIQIGDIYDLALIKTLPQQAGSIVFSGSTVVFDITVVNQGTLDATNIEITDYIPAGLTLSGTGWTQSGSLATQVIPALAASGSTTLSIEFLVDSTATGSIDNYAEISVDDGDDCDSMPDQIVGNDALTNDELGSRCDTNPDDEDDHDIESITVIIEGTEPSINVLKYSANQADQDGNTDDSNVTNDNQKINKTDDAIFKIVVSNDGAEDINTVVLTDALSPSCDRTDAETQLLITAIGNNDAIFNIGESFTYNCTDPNITADYTNSITVTAIGATSGIPTDGTDTSTVDVPNGGGGGGSATCHDINVLGNEVSCVGNTRSQSFRIDCDTSSTIDAFVYTNIYTLTSGRHHATVTCPTTPNEPKCYVAKSATGGPLLSESSWKSSQLCEIDGGGGGGSSCGDGILGNTPGEQCEKSPDSLGNLVFPAGCNSSCRLGGGGGGDPRFEISTSPSQTGIQTIPIGDGQLVFEIRADSIVLGDGMNAADGISEYPKVTNESDFDIHLSDLCLVKQSGYTLSDGDYLGQSFDPSDGSAKNGYCQSIPNNEVLYPGREMILTELEYAFTGNTDYLNGRDESFNDNIIAFTIKSDGKVYDTAYFATTVKLRVAKPSVVTTGGTAYFEDSFISNLADVSLNNNSANTNFGGVVIGDGNNLGDNTTVSDDNSVSESGDVFTQNNISDLSEPAITLHSYNNLDNIFIINGTDLRTSMLANSIDKPTTFIVENADLIVDDNVVYAHNVAFIVRGGNIKVKNNVTQMDGSYVATAKGSIGGNIQGASSLSTNNRLIVNGSLYGDTSDLISKRTYVKSAGDGQINVGTIVSFGSSFFRDPAPLLGKFIREYTDSQKIAR